MVLRLLPAGCECRRMQENQQKGFKSGKAFVRTVPFCKAQMLLSRIASRKSALGIMGKQGGKNMGDRREFGCFDE